MGRRRSWPRVCGRRSISSATGVSPNLPAMEHCVHARGLAVALLSLTLSASADAQQPQNVGPPGPLTLEQAVRQAVDRYPTVREQRARAKAAYEGVAVARTAYLPRVDLLWQ